MRGHGCRPETVPPPEQQSIDNESRQNEEWGYLWKQQSKPRADPRADFQGKAQKSFEQPSRGSPETEEREDQCSVRPWLLTLPPLLQAPQQNQGSCRRGSRLSPSSVTSSQRGVWGHHIQCSSPGLQTLHLFAVNAMVLRADQEEKSAFVLLPSAEGNTVCREQGCRGTGNLEDL